MILNNIPFANIHSSIKGKINVVDNIFAYNGSLYMVDKYDNCCEMATVLNNRLCSNKLITQISVPLEVLKELL